MGNDLLRISLKLFFTFQIDDLRTIIGMNKKEVAFSFHCFKKICSSYTIMNLFRHIVSRDGAYMLIRCISSV